MLGLAVAIRLPGLWLPLSGDEATTFWEHASSSWKTLFFQYKGPNQHSLFSFLSNISIQVFGENEFSFRLPSLAAGILIIPLTWLAGRLLLKSQSAALLAAFFVGFSAPLFESSQQGRGYTLGFDYFYCRKNNDHGR
jgi:mannosyltransferase